MKKQLTLILLLLFSVLMIFSCDRSTDPTYSPDGNGHESNNDISSGVVGDLSFRPWNDGYEVNYIGNTAIDTEIVIPKDYNGKPVVAIAEGAFADCTNLPGVIIPDTVSFIGSKAFNNCSSIKSINIPSKTNLIGDIHFAGCSALEEINIHQDNSTYCSVDGVLFSKDMSTLLYYPPSKACEIYNAPAEVKAVGEFAFSTAKYLKNATFSDDLLSVNDHAFRLNNIIETVDLGKSVTRIGEFAFNECSSLKSISLGSSLQYIGIRAFSECESIEKISLPNSLTTLEQHAFENCRSLSEINIPTGITALPLGIFRGCASLENLVIPATVTDIGESAFHNCTGLKSIILPNTIAIIEKNTFYGCSSLEDVIIPDSVKVIGESAFEKCASLESIVFPKSIESVSTTAFWRCSKLTSITLNSNILFGKYAFTDTCLEKIEYNGTLDRWNAFYNDVDFGIESGRYTVYCTDGKIGDFNYKLSADQSSYIIIGIGTYLENEMVIPGEYLGLPVSGIEKVTDVYRPLEFTSVTIPGTVKYIGQSTFANSSALQTIYLSEGIETIGDYAFTNCDLLSKVIIPNTVKSIGDGAFSYCSSLESITIPNSVNSLGDSLFRDCSSLKSIIIPESVKTIGEFAFGNCSSLESVAIYGEVADIEMYDVFYGCTSIKKVYLAVGCEHALYALTNCPLEEIHYSGTTEDINAYLSKETYLQIPSDCVIYCENGTVY